jgi:GNAT superfamily N-acetyltransferase
MTQGLHIRRLRADEPAFDIIARWRYDAFFAQDGGTFEESRDALRAWMDGLGYETALLAEVDGQPAGSCLFVREEIDPKHDLTPWLAALYVAPEFRKRDIASALVRAIEDHARDVGAGNCTSTLSPPSNSTPSSAGSRATGSNRTARSSC